MNLFEKASANASLVFVDDETGKEYRLNNLPFSSLELPGRELFFLYLDNSINAIGIFWNLMKSNHCLALLSPAISTKFKEDLESLYKPSYIYDPTRKEIPHFEINNPRPSLFKRTQAVSIQISKELKLLISTSGTTGSPKFVKLSEANLIANAESIGDYLPIEADDVTPLNLPVFYSYGLSVLTSNSLKGGKIVCSNDDVLKKEFWTKFEKFAYTSIAGVPFVYEMLDRIGFTKKIYPSLKYFTQAGGKLQDPLVKKYAEYAQAHNLEFFVMYGQTEATARMSYLPPNKLLEKIGSIGKPIKNGCFTIDPDTQELCYNGPNVYGGYVTNPEDLASFEPFQTLHTGDLARVDEEGFYYITGRMKRFAKIFGNRINLDEIEMLISKSLNVNIKCAGLNDKLLLLFSDEKNVNGEELAQFLSGEVKIHISVIKFVNVSEIPLTSNGKINYTKLVSDYELK